jgi:ATP-dependent protease ClpP protease subunit
MDGIIFIKGEIGKEYTYSHALIDLERNKEASILKIYIDTPGGSFDEGMKIYSLFRQSGKLLVTENSGMVASMGVTLFCLAPKGSRFYDPKKGEFFIHNPWGNPEGDADYLAEAARSMKKAEKELVNIYSLATGALPETISGLMAIQSSLTPDQVETLGFAKIINNELKAVAKLNFNEMTEAELNSKIDASAEGIFAKITNFFKKTGIIKALMLQTADGVTLDFGEEIQEASQITVDTPVKVDGAAAEGEYLMPDGSTIVAAGGKVTEIRPKVEEDEEMAALKAENETLKTQLAEAQANVTTAQSLVKGIESDFKAFKKQVTSDIKGLSKTTPPAGDDEPEIRKPFKK